MTSGGLLYELQRLLTTSQGSMVWLVSIQRNGWRLQAGVSKAQGFLPSGLILAKPTQSFLLRSACQQWLDTPSELWYWCARKRWQCQPRLLMLELPGVVNSYLLLFASADLSWQTLVSQPAWYKLTEQLLFQEQGLFLTLPPLGQSLHAQDPASGLPPHLLEQLAGDQAWQSWLGQDLQPWVLVSGDLHLLHANHSAKQLLGSPPTFASLPRMGLAAPLWQACDLNGQRLDSEDLPQSEAMRTQQPVSAKLMTLTNWQQQSLQVAVSVWPIAQPDGSLWLLMLLQDFSQWHQRQLQLELEVASMANLFNHLSDIILLLNGSGQILHGNQQAEQALQLSRSELLYQSINQFFAPDWRLALPHRQGIQVQGLSSGKDYQLSLVVMGDKTDRYLCRLFDLTDIQRQQQQLLQAQRLGAVGVLASGLAHDLNNMLGVIRGYAEMLQLGSAIPATQVAERILQSSDRASGLLTQLLNFASDKPRRRQTLCLNQLLQTNVSLLQAALGKPILTLNLPAGAIELSLEVDEFERALLNMVLNSRYALQDVDQGTLSISLSTVHLPQQDAAPWPLAGGEYAVIRIQDNGHGMSSEVLDRIFDPFFTTKGELGSGLGLSQLFGLVRRHQGKIDVESAWLQGSCFQLFLPMQPALVRAFEPAGVPLSSVKGLLVIDDDEQLLQLLQEQLPSKRLHVATNAQQALSVLASFAIEMVLLDVNLQQHSGVALAHTLRAQYPHLQVGFMSALIEQLRDTDIQAIQPLVMMAKPISIDRVRTWLQDDL